MSDVTAEAIAVTQDTNDPVLRVKTGDSKADIIIDTQAECLNVWSIESAEKGDMKKIMDWIVDKTGYDWVQFIAPMDDREKEVGAKVMEEMGIKGSKPFTDEGTNLNIREVLDGFQDVTEVHGGKEVPMLVGFWETGE